MAETPPEQLAASLQSHTSLRLGAPLSVRGPMLWRSADRISLQRVRRRRRTVTLMLAAALAVTAMRLVPPVATLEDAAQLGGVPLARAAARQVPLARPAPPPEDAATVFATGEGLELVLPAEEVRVVGFHEAAFTQALPMSPRGVLKSNDNTTKFTAPADTDDGPSYIVLSSRGRWSGATSAVDLVLAQGEPVRSLVTGTVMAVEPYALYGRYPDTKIAIAPEGHPDLRVVLIHVEGPLVTEGQHVEAGETKLARSATLFPFASHVDRYVGGERVPHVHVEVKRSIPGEGEDTAS